MQNKATNLLAKVLGQWVGVKISVSFFFIKIWLADFHFEDIMKTLSKTLRL